MRNTCIFIITGIPKSGKTFHAKKLSEIWAMTYVNWLPGDSDLLEDRIAQYRHLHQQVSDAKNGCIIDGWKLGKEELGNFQKEFKISCVAELMIDESESISRMETDLHIDKYDIQRKLINWHMKTNQLWNKLGLLGYDYVKCRAYCNPEIVNDRLRFLISEKNS